MIETQALADAGRGSICTMIGNKGQLFPPSYDGSVLTCLANSADGTGLQWTSTLSLSQLSVGGEIFGDNQVIVGTGSSQVTIGSGSIGVFAVSPPVSQAAFPGTATGTDKNIINAIVTLLAAYGFCASS